jgi:hypothetical protein
MTAKIEVLKENVIHISKGKFQHLFIKNVRTKAGYPLFIISLSIGKYKKEEKKVEFENVASFFLTTEVFKDLINKMIDLGDSRLTPPKK